MASKASSIQPRAAASRVRRCAGFACFMSWIGPRAMMRRAIVAVTLCICLHNELRELQLKIVDLPIFLKQIDERIPGFMDDLQPLMRTTEQILAARAGTDLAKAVQAQVAVAAEHYGGILA